VRPRRRALDGALSALAFLVLAQGYRLVTDGGPSLPVLLAVAVAVGVAGAALAAGLERLLAKRSL
jgi:hypothetical protein